jgi:hypothetical protein
LACLFGLPIPKGLRGGLCKPVTENFCTPSKLRLLFEARNLFLSGVALIPVLIAKMDLLSCFGGQVFCISGVASLTGLTFSLSYSLMVPMPTDGGGAGVALNANREGVFINRLEDRAPRGSRGAAGVVGRTHFGGGRAGVCDTGAVVLDVIGVFSALLLGFGVAPGT